MSLVIFDKNTTELRVLVACEESQEITKAFRNIGHEAFSCDMQPCSGGHPEWHIEDDVLLHIDTHVQQIHHIQ